MSFMHSNFDPNKHQRYVPTNKEKYKGKSLPIARSSWELKVMQFLDYNSNVLQWSSESLSIPYYNPLKQKICRYYPDFVVKIRNKEGIEEIFIIEIKPSKEVKQPINIAKKSKKNQIYEQKTYITNSAKWNAAIDYCNKKGFKFKIITEKTLFNK